MGLCPEHLEPIVMTTKSGHPSHVEMTVLAERLKPNQYVKMVSTATKAPSISESKYSIPIESIQSHIQMKVLPSAMFNLRYIIT